MSFGVCRVEKIKGAAAVAGLQIHNNRERMHSNTNPDIDRSRSELNYSLIEQDSHNYNKLIEERLQQGYKGKKAIRKDAVKMCEMLFTSDGNFFSRLSEQEQRQFFLDCFEFAAQRYGKENIIAATVHLDEATPHMHLDFVPLTPDGRLSAKDLLGGRKEMQQLQDDFYSTVSSKYGLERGSRADLESGDRPRKHLETAEYKEKLAAARMAAADQIEQIAEKRIQAAGNAQIVAEQSAKEAEQIAAEKQKQTVQYQQEAEQTEAKVKSRQQELVQLEQRQVILQSEIDASEIHLQALQGQILTTGEVNRLNGKKTLTGALRGITYEDYLNLKATAERVDQAERILAETDKIIDDANKKAEEVISEAKKKAEKLTAEAKSSAENELKNFILYEKCAKEALSKYKKQKKQNDDISQITSQSKEKLTEIQKQISLAEQERERIKGEIESFNKTIEKLSEDSDERYCYYHVDSLLFSKLMETVQEYDVAVRNEKNANGTITVKSPVSEKKYLTLAVEKAKKLVILQSEQQMQIKVVQTTRRRGPNL